MKKKKVHIFDCGPIDTSWIEVGKDIFDQHVKDYPNKLTRDLAGMCDPPMLSYNDFTNGNVWPESMVAKASLGAHVGLDNRYWIKVIK